MPTRLPIFTGHSPRAVTKYSTLVRINYADLQRSASIPTQRVPRKSSDRYALVSAFRKLSCYPLRNVYTVKLITASIRLPEQFYLLFRIAHPFASDFAPVHSYSPSSSCPASPAPAPVLFQALNHAISQHTRCDNVLRTTRGRVFTQPSSPRSIAFCLPRKTPTTSSNEPVLQQLPESYGA